MGFIKGFFKTLAMLYVSAYILTTSAAIIDNRFISKEKIEDSVNNLHVHNFNINIDDEKNYLTLSGECHIYTKQEYEVAKSIVNKHRHFAAECGSDVMENITSGNLMYCLVAGITYKPYLYFFQLGSDRHYDTISELAEEKGYFIHALEDPDDPFDNLSFSERCQFLGDIIASAFVAPIGYFRGKYEAPLDASAVANYRFKNSLITKRDSVMAENIIKLLSEDEIDSLSANIGLAHLDGVINNLHKLADIVEVK